MVQSTEAAGYRRAFTFAYDMASLGKGKQEQKQRSAEQGGEGPFGWPQSLKENAPGSVFPDQDLKGLKAIDSFLKIIGGVFRRPDN